MPASRPVTGTHTFTFPYRIGGGLAAELDCRCHYEVHLGRPAMPHSGEPAEPDEISEVSEIEVEVTDKIPAMQFEGYVAGVPRFRRRWVPAGDLEGTIRRYLLSEGAQTLLEEARTEGVEA